MKISVCLIVKDEEATLRRCLCCVTGFADEIIITDTGSSDKTKKIAAEFTDKIYDFKWIDDFSAARNYSFDKATGDYIFWLDADDVISGENADKIIKIKESDEQIDTYMFKYAVGFDDKGDPSFEYYRERLMRNCRLARFKGFVHEAIAPFGKIKLCDITIEHRKVNTGDPRRNLELYEKHLSMGEKLDGRGQYYYAKEFYFLGDYAKSKKELLKFLDMNTKYIPDVKDAYVSVYKCEKKSGGNGDLKLLFSALERVGADSEIFCYIGDCYLAKGDTEQAVTYYKCALCVKDPTLQYGFYERKFYYLEPLLRLTATNYNSGNKKTAEFYQRVCEEKYPTEKEVIFNSRFFSADDKNEV